MIRHLVLTFEAERPPPPRVIQQDLLISAGRKREVFLRALLVVLCLLEGRAYLELDGLEIPGNLYRFVISLTSSDSL